MSSSVASRTRKQMRVRLLEMYREQRRIKEASSSGSKNGEPTIWVLDEEADEGSSQNTNQDNKQNEVEENHAKGVTAEHAENANIKGIDEGRETAPDKMIESSDDSDEEMSSDSSSSETENSDDEDFSIYEDSDEGDSSSDESSSETDEDDVTVTGKIGNDDHDGKVIGIDSDDMKEINKEGRDGIKERGASSSAYRKEEERWKSSKKRKGHRDGREVLKIGKGPAKEILNEEDSDCEGKREAADGEKGHVETKVQERRNVKKKSSRVMNILVENIVHGSNAAAQDTAPPSGSSTTLPLKFRFPDSDDDIESEKDELELECEGLFDEMYFNLQYKETATHNRKIEDEAEYYPEAKRNADTICSEEGHDTYLDEEIGLICNRCNRVVTEIKDVMPSFAKDRRIEIERRRYISGKDSVLDKFDFRCPEDDVQNLHSHTIGTVWSLIPGIRVNMYPHQQEGFEFLWKNMAGTINLDELKKENDNAGGGCIISHAPGTGKTRLTILFLQTYLKMFPQCYPVIIAPAGMLLTWEEEFKKWNFEFPFHNLNNPEFSGKESDSFRRLISSNKCQDRKVARLVKLGSWSEGKSVLGISYSLYGRKTKKMKAVLGYQDEQVRKVLLERPKLVILDEGHTPRNKKSSIWKCCLELQTERRIILSGTPFQNSFNELFNTLELVRPSLAKALDKKLRFVDVPRQSASKHSRKRLRYEEPSSDVAIESLKVAMAPFVHVHRGSILQESLPGLRDAVILLKPSELQKKLIEGNQQLQKKDLQGTFEFEYHEAMLSVHPCLSKDKGSSLIEKSKLEKLRLDYDEGVKTKFTVALIHLSLSKPEKEKVLVFSQYIDPLDLIRDQLSEHLGYGSNEVLQMQGHIDQKSRKSMIDKFNDPNSSAKVMLASTKCCSEGISLVGASRVVLLDVAWNPSVESQAISRAFRIGQNRVVYTYHLMTSGTTEVDKYCRQVEKDRFSELVFAQKNSEKRWKRPVEISDDVILEKMLENEKLKGMFQKIIHQPKEKKLLECFGIPSYPQYF